MWHRTLTPAPQDPGPEDPGPPDPGPQEPGFQDPGKQDLGPWPAGFTDDATPAKGARTDAADDESSSSSESEQVRRWSPSFQAFHEKLQEIKQMTIFLCKAIGLGDSTIVDSSKIAEWSHKLYENMQMIRNSEMVYKILHKYRKEKPPRQQVVGLYPMKKPIV